MFSPFHEISFLKDDVFANKLIDKIYELIYEKPFDNMRFSKNTYFLFPKSDFSSYRKCALVQITDEIKYLSLVLNIARDIEKARLQKSKKYIFSYRYSPSPDGYLFDPKFNYQAFRYQIGRIISENKYQVMIKCDISNFYDRINIHRLISKLHTISTKKEIITKIDKLLLYWADRNSYSLPVGSNASRILSEAALIDVDKFLLTKNIRFVRFVDDFRIFCKDVVEAQKILNLLIDRLDQEGLYLNSKKTEFVDLTEEGDKFKYFKANESNLSEDEKRERLKIIRGYNGNIPTKFKKLSKIEIEKYSKIDCDNLYKQITNKTLIASNDLIYLIKVLIANNKYSLFLKLCSSLKKFPQLIPYYISAFNKTKNSIEDIEEVRSMKLEFINMLKCYQDYPTYVLIYIIRLFDNDKEYSHQLYDIYLESPKNINPYFGRRILEALQGNLERYQLLELKTHISNVSLWEKRAILMCLKKGLYDEEFKPIFKDYLISDCDELIFDICELPSL